MTRRASRGSNKNRRPSAKQGRALKAWLLGTFGDGITAPCAMCGRGLLYSEITKDLWPKPARRGGRYVKGNIRPACLSCNARDGARQAAAERTERRLRHEAELLRRRTRYAERKASGAVRRSEGLGMPEPDEHPLAA